MIGFDERRRGYLRGLGAAGALALAVAGRGARAQAWPAKPIRVIVPFPAGGTPDVTVRRIAERIAPMLGQPVVVENRPGAAALIGAKAVAAAPPDGYTIGYLSSGHATVQAITGRLDLEKEFRPIAMVGSSPFLAAVNPSSPWRTLREVLDAARAQPGRLTVGSAGVGSPAHIAFERMRERLPGLDLNHVPFKGAVESYNAIVGGQIDFTVSVLGAALPHLQAQRLRPLAVTTSERLAMLPAVPTMVEAGVPGYRFDAWGGFAAPAGTPDDVIARLYTVIARAAGEPDYRAFAESQGAQSLVSASPQAFARDIAETLAVERATVQRLGLKES
ncbi:MAG: tripartite tricarboxylate transporter substrate binding protein [Burkholderiales bacterium]|jgi:tripartite-type tricarboxylate transporter receptor subunit TctC